MCSGIVIVAEDLPSRFRDTVSTLSNRRYIHTNCSTRQHDIGFVDITNLRHTTLEVDVDVHDVALTHWCHIESRLVTLIILIEVDNGDNFLCRKVIDIRLIRNIEGADLRRRCAMDDEALLEIAETIIGGFIDNNTLRN